MSDLQQAEACGVPLLAWQLYDESLSSTLKALKRVFKVRMEYTVVLWRTCEAKNDYV